MSKITASTAFTQCKPEDLPRFLALFGDDVTKQINGQLDFATNFNGKIVTVNFTNANTNTTTTHNLGRVPSGYIQCGATAAMSIFDGSTASTTTTLTLQSSAAGTARLLIF